MSHTPGPWSATVAKTDHRPNERHAYCYRAGDVLIQGDRTIAIVDLCNAEADGRLIAAAPELLAICQAIAADSRVVRLHTKHQEQLAAIIAKATNPPA